MSAQIYMIGCLHLGHTNMALKRGFETVEEHDNHIIKMWNSIVKKNDVVYILGDITMEKSSPYPLLNKLNGFKKVILGNHDLPQHIPKLLEYVNNVSGMFDYKGCVFTHCPIHESEINRYRFNFHAHVHENSLEHPKYINVSCEAINYIPVLLSKYLNK